MLFPWHCFHVIKTSCINYFPCAKAAIQWSSGNMLMLSVCYILNSFVSRRNLYVR